MKFKKNLLRIITSTALVTGNLGLEIYGVPGPKTKNLMIYSNYAYLTDKTINTRTTLDYVEAYHGTSYSYHFYPRVDLNKEYNETTDTWPHLSRLLREAQKRGIDIWVTFENPINYQNGYHGLSGRKMLYKEWIASLAKLSKIYPIFKGVIIDDFGENNYWANAKKWKDINGNHLFTPEYLSELKTLKNQQNPNYKFYVVLYWGNLFHPGFERRKQYIDGLVYPYMDASKTRGPCDESLRGSDYYEGDGCDDWGPYNTRYWDTFNSEIRAVKSKLIENQDLLTCVYVTKHSKLKRANETYLDIVLRKGIEQTDGIYAFTLIRTAKIFNETFCDNLRISESQVNKNACVLKKVFSEYNP